VLTRRKVSPEEKFRQMALASLKDRARARMQGKPDPGTAARTAGYGQVKTGVVLSDQAAKSIAAALTIMLRS
jgi:hypothetical protein